jgi:hypothetical protein
MYKMPKMINQSINRFDSDDDDDDDDGALADTGYACVSEPTGILVSS